MANKQEERLERLAAVVFEECVRHSRFNFDREKFVQIMVQYEADIRADLRLVLDGENGSN